MPSGVTLTSNYRKLWMKLAKPTEPVLKNTWINTNPMFYNLDSHDFASKINTVYEKNFQWDPNGLLIYLIFGYSAFGLTPIRGISYTQANQQLNNKNGTFSVINHPDPIAGLKFTDSQNVDYVIELVRNSVREWEKSFDGEIILPLSGGLDSRLLLWCVEDKSRIRSFTFGLTPTKSNSREIEVARKLAKKFSIKWEPIDLGNYLKWTSRWIDIYGVSTHAHGMYQMEFYSQIAKSVSRNGQVLSGIIGDAWAGSLKIPKIKEPSDLVKLSLSRDHHALPILSISKSEAFNKFSAIPELLEYFQKNEDLFKDERLITVEIIRNKMMLLRYLLDLPKEFGLDTYSPFIDSKIATEMLNLSPELRMNRRWLKDFFYGEGLDFELKEIGQNDNDLNVHQISSYKTKELETPEHVWDQFDLRRTARRKINLSRYFGKTKIVNGGLLNKSEFFKILLSRIENKLNYKFTKRSRALENYYSYLTVVPLISARMKRP